MGQRGPAPQPAALRLLKGERRPSQLKAAPSSGLEPPRKPGDLTPAAALVWDRVLAATALTAHIGAAHLDTFRHYCEVTASIAAMNPKGTREWRELVNTHRQLAKELLLTPSTSGGLPKAQVAVDPLAKYGIN